MIKRNQMKHIQLLLKSFELQNHAYKSLFKNVQNKWKEIHDVERVNLAYYSSFVQYIYKRAM